MMEEFIKQVTYIISAVDESRDVLSRFLYYLEFILGVTEGCTPSKVPFLFDCLLPVLRSLLPLLKTLVGHSEAVLLILQVFSHCSEHFLPHLPEVSPPSSGPGCVLQIPPLPPGQGKGVVQGVSRGPPTLFSAQHIQVQRRDYCRGRTVWRYRGVLASCAASFH
jgi:hypothetical protein